VTACQVRFAAVATAAGADPPVNIALPLPGNSFMVPKSLSNAAFSSG
jgi:hypothetical protein